MTQETRKLTSRTIEELYRPPGVDEPAPEAPLVVAQFYVVSRTKFLLLFILTMSGYSFYWFYENWRRYRAHSQEDLSPFWRAVFSIFFAHRLFREIDAEARKAGPAPVWSPDGMATLFVLVAILSQLLTRVASIAKLEQLDIVAVACGLVMGYPLYCAQRASNVAARDPDGASNAKLTATNYVFIVIGSLTWFFFTLSFV